MKILNILLLNLLLIVCISCNSSNSNKAEIIKEIESDVELSNLKCPMQISEINNVVMEKISFEDNTLTYHYTLETFNGDYDKLKDLLIHELKGTVQYSPEYKKFVENIVEAGGKIVYNYTTQDGQTIKFELSNKELASAIK